MKAAALVLFLSGRAWGGEIPPVGAPVEARQLAAQEALEALRGQVDASNFRDAGFEDPSEIARARLGVGLPVYWGVRTQWARFRPGDDPSTVLTDMGRSVHLVTVDGLARCLISLEHDDGRWRRESFGSGSFARRLAAARSAASRTLPESQNSDFLVDIVAMRFHLLGRRNGGRVTLTAIAAGYGLSAGETRPAEEMIAHLGAIAGRELRREAERK